MARANTALYAFNRGIISPLALCRIDLDRTALSAETMVNWEPRALGSMSIRRGTKYLGASASNNQAFHIPFKFSNSDTALLEFTNNLLRVWVSDALITRPSVTSTIANGTFGTDLASWTDGDDSGAVSAFESGGYMALQGTGIGGAAAKRTQEITVSGGNVSVEHALRIVILHGPVTLKVGSTSGADDYIEETSLGTGTHSLTLTPTGNFFIQFLSYTSYKVMVDSVAIESAGVMTLTSPYPTSALRLIRFDQSGDVIYLACEGYHRYKVERRSARSWSIVKFKPENGAFRSINTSPITITPTDTEGDITLTSSASLFRSGHAGALFKITHTSQKQNVSITAQNTFSDPIEVTGVGGGRSFSVLLTNTFSATVTLQYSVGVVGSWVDYDTYTTELAISVNDGLDNQIIYYRIGVKTGEFTSGQCDAVLTHSSGAQTGIVRINSVSSATTAAASVLTEMGSTDATADWYEEAFSDYRGQPSAVRLLQGRLYWMGSNRLVGSVSDAYESYDEEVEGDSSCINRTIGVGTVDSVNWAEGTVRMLIGTPGSELEARTSLNDDPITPSNLNISEAGTQGTAQVAAVKVDASIMFVPSSKTRLYQALYTYEQGGFVENDVSIHAPEVCEPEIVKIVVQRKPDTRIHCVRSDGKVAIILFDRNEEIACWYLMETDGNVEDAVVLPGTIEDAVYYSIKRTINSNTVRYLEKFATENECKGGTYVYSGTTTTSLTDLPYPDGMVVTVYNSSGTKVENLTVSGKAVTLSTTSTYALLVPATHLLADSFITYSGSLASAMSGLTHLEGETVVVRGDGKDLGTYTVSSGAITLSETVRKAVIGLPYTAKWKSTKLAYIHAKGTGLSQRKSINSLSLIMRDVYYQGIQTGPSFDDMDKLPFVQDGKTTDSKYIWQDYDKDMEPFIRGMQNDARLCIQAAAPNPCTVLGAVIGMETNG